MLITWEAKALNNNVMGKTQRDIIMQNIKVSLLSVVIETDQYWHSNDERDK